MRSFDEWLHDHGLAQYAAAFRANDIDFSIVNQLSEVDLRELGLSLGHRELFFAARADLGTTMPVANEEPLPSGAERRQLTVLFCDLVGSVSLAERLDPEDLRRLIQTYRTRCSAIIKKYDGHVARFVGDGILSYFGWPQGHEDDAERAVRAAIDLVATVKTVSPVHSLSVHIGIATGPVVVGRDEDEPMDARLAVGATPNLAARLQSLACANEIYISATTRRLVAQHFELEDLGKCVLKDIDEPVQIIRVTRVARMPDRFAASHGSLALSPMIGRDEELRLLLARWAVAAEGDGQVLLLGGEAGIGKSRLIHLMRAAFRAGDPLVLHYQCSPYHVHSPLYPVIAELESAIGLQRDDSDDENLDRLETFFAQGGGTSGEFLGVFAALLSLPIGGYLSADLQPHRRKALMFNAWLQFIESRSESRLLLLIFEDAHWIDSATQELLDALVPLLQQRSVLLIVTHRPEYSPPWASLGHVTSHSLNRLTKRQAGEMVQGIGGDRRWPAELLDQIVSNADGVPLFVEELTKAILESGIVRRTDGQYELTGPLLPLAVPATLMDSLTTRLDRFGRIKEVAQIGACIGREFRRALLAMVVGLPSAKLQDALDQLVRAQILFRHGYRRACSGDRSIVELSREF